MTVTEPRGKKMIKAFWLGDFPTLLGGILVGLGVGLALGSYSHPYEVCKRMYDTSEDVSECVWIKENN
jgi:hypothetical protein